MMPGRTLHRLAARICSERSLERIVEPAIADLQKEYADTMLRSLSRRAQVLLLGYAGILEVIAMTALEMSLPVGNERSALLRTFFWAAVVTACASGLLVAFTIAAVPVFAPFYIALLTPMTLPIALPIGLTFGIAFGLGNRGVSRHTKRIVLFSAVLVTVLSFSSMAWVKPVANQSFRQSVFSAIGGRGTVMKGLNEMSISELYREARMAPRGDATQMPARASWMYHLTCALPIAPLVLSVLALTLIARGVRNATVIAMCVAYYLLLVTTEALVYEGLPPAAGAWIPNAMFAAAAVYFMSSQPSNMHGSFRPAQ
jgi:hypothetical protein